MSQEISDLKTHNAFSIRTPTHYAAKQACKQRPDKPVAILLDTKAFKLNELCDTEKSLASPHLRVRVQRSERVFSRTARIPNGG